MHVRFVLVSPASKIRERAVGLPVVVGRGPEAGLRIAQDSVSRRHCEIFEKSGSVFLRDLGSTNGTFVGGVQISTSAAVALEPGTEVRVGDSRFRIEFEQPAMVRQPATAAPALTGAEDDLDIPDLTPPDTEPQQPAAPLPAAPVPARAKPTTAASPARMPAAPLAAPAAEPPDMPAPPPARSAAPTARPAEPPAFPVDAAAPDEPPLIDAEAAAAADEAPANAFSFPGTDVAAEEPPASFDFLAPEAAPQQTDDGSLDDFLRGLQ